MRQRLSIDDLTREEIEAIPCELLTGGERSTPLRSEDDGAPASPTPIGQPA
jgi:hypothetical protein